MKREGPGDGGAPAGCPGGAKSGAAPAAAPPKDADGFVSFDALPALPDGSLVSVMGVVVARDPAAGTSAQRSLADPSKRGLIIKVMTDD